ncbi:M23 family metallopeptidase [Aeromicrobium ginsengisoli]|uniref:Peptidoglycan DD-metalloendopeptidase family protein n=1 Tax=Aeromicrobium ginsengisoli TaxID=363867 RepID=A0A5M4FGQ0_9ACTN|nr:peptidoglycan DD-metalloendopeptidase family protein [Aeromicrobium ginsengisoli]KAA1398061.1 peptidoglycan DD-metalloendopeptidase family protein [Aeromicrobium ginsengisoli]
MLRRIAVAPLLLLLVMPPPVQAGTPDPWTWPLEDHAIGERFDPPATDYGRGHRGVDLAATAGDAVRAVAAGRVVFAGQVGGIAVVTIDHGRERSTYQPVKARVRVGDAVRAGQVIGTLLGSPSHCAGACLHLGRLVGDDYLDPLELLGGGRFRLIDPAGKPPAPPAGVGGHRLQRPLGGPITSPFGMRVHPITGERKLHDGTDFGVPCGTPVHAAAAGTVVGHSHSKAYGKQVVIRHQPEFKTSYSHLSAQSVSVGDRVTAGQVIGRSGNTGLSTGCHLHFMALKSGKPVNPQDFL